uniref:Uncharacterized protein n=1 Tax=Nicotiana tabacum TaxID=4097 RepID=A0A1S3ZSA0_TOBAC|nr:PREDICTED: uncharacterized protein LOC107789921 [Nicotiana tabacum]
MDSSKSIYTPISIETKLDLDEKGKSVEHKLYRGMIGSLLYLTASKLDIVFSVGLCARFQANPKESHLKAVKRILRYFKGTFDMCLWYPRGYNFDLVGYADVGYAVTMFKSSQTPSKEKSSSKSEVKPKNMKPKPKKSAKSTTEPAPAHVPSLLIPSTVLAQSSHIPVAPAVSTSTGPSSPKPPSHAPVFATSRKSVKDDKVVICAAIKEDTVVKKVVAQGESVPTTTDQVKLPPSKLDVLVSAIEVAPLEIVPPISDKPRVKETNLETDIAT